MLVQSPNNKRKCTRASMAQAGDQTIHIPVTRKQHHISVAARHTPYTNCLSFSAKPHPVISAQRYFICIQLQNATEPQSCVLIITLYHQCMYEYSECALMSTTAACHRIPLYCFTAVDGSIDQRAHIERGCTAEPTARICALTPTAAVNRSRL